MIDVKSTMSDFNLGQKEKWSKEDLEFLLHNGAYVNKSGFVHIPLDKISGTVPFGRADKSEPNLWIGGHKLNQGKRSSKILKSAND